MKCCQIRINVNDLVKLNAVLVIIHNTSALSNHSDTGRKDLVLGSDSSDKTLLKTKEEIMNI